MDKIKYFSSFYWNNVKGVFRFLDSTLGIPLLAGYQVLALPISLTLGALIKTFVDLFTRKILPAEQMQQLNDKINALNGNDSTIEPLIEKIKAYSPQSNASEQLQEKLKEIEEVTEITAKNAEYRKKKALQIEQLTTAECSEPCTVYDDMFIDSQTLDNERQKELIDYMRQCFIDCSIQKTGAQTTVLQGYLNNNENAGTRMGQIIYGHFFQASPAISADPTLNSNCSLN